jgi:serine/threonine protein kinase
MNCIFAAMEYMHNNNIVHRDLKPGKHTFSSSPFLDNILIGDSSDVSTVKVADFGLSAKYE